MGDAAEAGSAPTTSTAFLEAEGLSRAFAGRPAVTDLSFSVHRGEILGLLGPNGAGKTTTLRLLTGFLLPDRGSVRIDGLTLAPEATGLRRRFGYLPEGAPLFGEMRPRRFLRHVAAMQGIAAASVAPALDRVAERTGIAQVLDRRIETLSKGYRRRVALAAALIHDPDILILDEPTDGLDPNQKAVLRQLLTDLKADKAILISTHQLDEAEALCDRLLLLNDGRPVKSGPPESLAAHGGGSLAAAFSALTQGAAS